MTETTPNTLNAPWTLHLDSDGFGDLGVILDASGEELVTSRPFRQPDGDDERLLAAVLAMKAAPNLLKALVGCLALLDRSGVSDADPVIRAAVSAINEATEWTTDAAAERLAA